MFVDISELAGDLGVAEKISVTTLKGATADEAGIQVNPEEEVFETVALLIEKSVNVLDVGTGSYLPKITYDFYMPREILVGKKLKGSTIKRENGTEYIVTSDVIIRKYVSHCVVGATEKRVVDDRIKR